LKPKRGGKRLEVSGQREARKPEDGSSRGLERLGKVPTELFEKREKERKKVEGEASFATGGKEPLKREKKGGDQIQGGGENLTLKTNYVLGAARETCSRKQDPVNGPPGALAR